MRVRVLTLNVWNREGAAKRIGLINAAIKELQPDLISLQEAVRTPASDQLADLLDGMDYHTTHQADMQPYTPPFADRFGGAAVASRWPHRRLEAVDARQVGANDVPWATLAVAVSLPDLGELLFIGTTSAWRLNAEAARERQALALADLDSRHRKTLPTIIAGDFNAAPEAASIRFLTGLQSLEGRSVQYHDAWALAGDGDGITWSSDNPNAATGIDQIVRQSPHHRRIDYVFIGGWDAHPHAQARVLEARRVLDRPVAGIWPSDHFGVFVTLEITQDDG